MKTTSYYQRVETMLRWLSAVEDDGKNIAEVRKLFRNIQSRAVIPEDVYNKNSEQIDKYLELLPLTNKSWRCLGMRIPKCIDRELSQSWKIT